MKYHLSKPSLDKKELYGITKIINKPWLINGPTVKKFELNFKKFNYLHCTTVSSCTAGLQLVLQSLNQKMMKDFNVI